MEKKEKIVLKNKKEENLPKMRQIIIETDGNQIKIIKAEVGGKIEFIGILQSLINYMGKNDKE